MLARGTSVSCRISKKLRSAARLTSVFPLKAELSMNSRSKIQASEKSSEKR